MNPGLLATEERIPGAETAFEVSPETERVVLADPLPVGALSNGLSMSRKSPDMVEIPRALFDRLTDTLSYAA